MAAKTTTKKAAAKKITYENETRMLLALAEEQGI